MALKATFNPHTVVTSRMRAFGARFEQALLLVLNEFGVELVKCAREQHNYTDRTGNLTNSIWYAVIKGRTVLSTGGGATGNEGASAAMETIMGLAGNNATKYTLAVVAGMEYAAAVESRGYNVLIPAELKANREFMGRMKSLFSKFDSKLREATK